MKLLVYLLLFIVLIYINNDSIKFYKEDFELPNALFTDKPTYEVVNTYDAIDDNNIKPLPDLNKNDFIVPYNDMPQNNILSTNWNIQNSDYSDIFNGQDSGGNEISNILELPKPKVLIDKTMMKISNNLLEQQKEQIIDRTIATVISAETETNGQKDNRYPLEIKHNNLKYNLLGYVYNTSYKQYYLLYETQNKQINPNLVLREKLDNLDNQIFTYALVKMEKSNPIIKYVFGPRTKININDVVYLSQGTLQLGPLVVDSL